MYFPNSPSGCTNGCPAWRAKASSAPTPSSPASARTGDLLRYSRVEKANGEAVPLKEYLEHVLGGGIQGSPLDHLPRRDRLRPRTGRPTDGDVALDRGRSQAHHRENAESAEEDEDRNEEESSGRSSASSAVNGFTLEFDAARKIAQGLASTWNASDSIVEVKATKPACSRSRSGPSTYSAKTRRAAGVIPLQGEERRWKQPSLFEELDEAEEATGGKELKGPPPGTTILDRLHQAMILFGAQRGRATQALPGRGRRRQGRPLLEAVRSRWPPSIPPAPTNAAGSKGCWPARRGWAVAGG